MAIGYAYARGDTTLAASFGYLLVVVGHQYEGQLTVAAARMGVATCLPEFGGAPHATTAIGTEGCLNVLRYRGQLAGAPTGPSRLPRVGRAGPVPGLRRPARLRPLGSRRRWHARRRRRARGARHVVTGERAEQFAVANARILLLARTTPTLLQPGDYAFTVGIPEAEFEVPAGF